MSCGVEYLGVSDKIGVVQLSVWVRAGIDHAISCWWLQVWWSEVANHRVYIFSGVGWRNCATTLEKTLSRLMVSIELEVHVSYQLMVRECMHNVFEYQYWCRSTVMKSDKFINNSLVDNLFGFEERHSGGAEIDQSWDRRSLRSEAISISGTL